VTAALLLSATDAPAGTLTVTNGNDSGAGSLRRAILFALPGDTINFAPSVTTVNLTSDELAINKDLTIIGPGANRLTVQRSTDDLDFRIFHITPSTVTVSISGLTISNGRVSFLDDGGGIRSAGVLTLTECIISGNQAGPGAGGGGVVNENGTMTITRCTISNNTADQSGYALEVSEGGGILNDSGGSLIITNSIISGNRCSATDGDPFLRLVFEQCSRAVDEFGGHYIVGGYANENTRGDGGIDFVSRKALGLKISQRRRFGSHGFSEQCESVVGCANRDRRVVRREAHGRTLANDISGAFEYIDHRVGEFLSLHAFDVDTADLVALLLPILRRTDSVNLDDAHAIGRVHALRPRRLGRRRAYFAHDVLFFMSPSFTGVTPLATMR
jgi:hypothetical protein